MRCPYCADGSSRVLDSREVGRGVRRRRICQSCGQRFTTYETQPSPVISVIKRDGHLEGYDRTKLLRSVQAVCHKRPVSATSIEDAIDRVEADLTRLGTSTVNTRHIVDLALAQLSRLDEVAYLYYASSTRGIRDADGVLAEIDVLRSLQRRHEESRVQLRLQFDEDQPHWN